MNETFEGIVLFKRPYREHDALVKIFTEHKGTKMFFVKGLNKPNHPLMSHTLPLTKHKFVGVINQEGLSFLSEGQTIDLYRHVQMDMDMQAYAVYISQLIDAATPDNEPHALNYQLLNQVLHKLNQQFAPEIVTAYVELFLLPQFGIYLNLSHCSYCDEVKGPFDFSLRQLGLLCPRHYAQDEFRLRINPNAIFILQTINGTNLDRLHSINVQKDILLDIRRLMDSIYQEYVGLKLRSKSYLDQLNKLNDEAYQLKQLRKLRKQPSEKDENEEKP